MNARDQIITQLKALPKTRIMGSNAMICCPNPDHKDDSPSCSVFIGRSHGSVPLGFAFCWGCKWKGPWSEVAKLLRLRDIQGSHLEAEPVDIYTRQKLLPTIWTMSSLLDSEGCSGEEEIIRRTWRGISRGTLKRLRCFDTMFTHEDGWSKDIMFFPCYVNGSLVGGIKTNIAKREGRLSYINTFGEWSKTRGLFGFDDARLNTAKDMPLVLVEGPRDALTLIQEGFPGIAILGTKSFSKEKAQLLLNLDRPIIIYMDSDRAGVEGARLLRDVFEEMLGDDLKGRVYIFNTRKRSVALGLDPQDGYDAASAPEELREEFASYYNRVKRQAVKSGPDPFDPFVLAPY